MKIFQEKRWLTEATIKKFIAELPIKDHFSGSRFSQFVDASELKLENHVRIGGGPVESILLLMCRAKQKGIWSDPFVIPLACKLHSQESELSKLKPIEMRESLQYPFAIETTERSQTGRGFSVWQYYDALDILPFWLPVLWVEPGTIMESEYFNIYPDHPAFPVVGRICWPFNESPDCLDKIQETESGEILVNSMLRFCFYSFPRSIEEINLTPDMAYLSYKSETEDSELVIAYASTKI